MPSIDEVYLQAKNNRPDIILAQQQLSYQNQNIKLQKSIAKPDVAFNFGYDKAGSFGNNYFGIGAAMDLPVFNKNQGNIQIAEFESKQAEVNKNVIENTLQHEVWGAYQDLLNNKKQVENLTPEYKNNLKELMEFATLNYSKHYISLLDYLDQLRTYTNAQNDILDLESAYQNSIATLNYKTGSPIIN